jgi:8-oxo-dGTP diphosphatase
MGHVLLIIAIFLLYLLVPVTYLYMVIRTLVSRKPKKFLKLWAGKTARSLDVLFNVIGADMLTDILIKEGGYKFGNKKETISSVIGKNDRMGTLTRAGRFLRWLLDKIEEEHCKNAINDELTNTFK